MRRQTKERRVAAEHGLLPFEMHQLATYNSEVARGLVHTTEWQDKMREFQARWNFYEGRTPRVNS